jgi:hypothetical protein
MGHGNILMIILRLVADDDFTRGDQVKENGWLPLLEENRPRVAFTRHEQGPEQIELSGSQVTKKWQLGKLNFGHHLPHFSLLRMYPFRL